MFDCVTFRGTPYEMGLQHGRAFRHVIRGNVHAYPMRHTFQGTDEEMDAGTESARRSDEKYAPWVFDELRGIADGSGVDPIWIERMHLRVWNTVPNKALDASGCTVIGMITEDAGVVVGGTLDDPRQSYVLVRRVPREGIPHLQVMWAGVGWGHNGINEAGFCLATASLGAVEPEDRTPQDTYGLNGTVGRVMLQTCQTVAEAVDVLRRMGCRGSYVLGDAAGDLVTCQSLGRAHAFQRPERGLVFCTNHVHMGDLANALEARGSKPVVTDYSRVRFETLQAARAGARRRLEEMKGLLRSHEGYPHSICNEGTVMGSIAAPQTQPGKLHIADRPPCRNEFVSYEVGAKEA